MKQNDPICLAHFLYRPGMCFIGKLLPGELPGFFKKRGLPVCIQVFFALPYTIGKKSRSVVFILPQLYMMTALKVFNLRLPPLKKALERSHFFRFKYHFYNTYDHSYSKKTLMV